MLKKTTFAALALVAALPLVAQDLPVDWDPG
jgi:hypothetical protein